MISKTADKYTVKKHKANNILYLSNQNNLRNWWRRQNLIWRTNSMVPSNKKDNLMEHFKCYLFEKIVHGPYWTGLSHVIIP